MISTLTGPNTFLMQQELQTRITAFKDQYGDFGLESFNAAETPFENIRQAVQSVPFLSSARMVIVYDPSTNKELVEQVESFIADIPKDVLVLLVEQKIDKRSVLYKTLKKKSELIEFAQLEEQSQASWVEEVVRQNGGTISKKDSLFLVQRAGFDQLRIKNELDKLQSYSPHITKETIELLVEPSPQGNVFNLLDAAFAGRAGLTMRLYDEQRSQKVEPQAILAMMGWQLHILALVKTAVDRPPELIAKEAKLNPFVVRKSLAIANNRSLTELKQLIDDAVQLDIQLKTKPINADEALKNLLLNISKN